MVIIFSGVNCLLYKYNKVSREEVKRKKVKKINCTSVK